ncbi:MAG: hypothetical protein ACOCV2_04340, partial [Persicimonas sp.]
MSNRPTRCPLALWVITLLVSLALIAGCGGDDSTGSTNNLGDPDTEVDAGDDASQEQHGAPVEVETELPESSVEAGTTVEVTCELLDEDGNTTESHQEEVDPKIEYGPSDSFEEDGDLTLIPTTVGDAEVACEYPNLGLIDESPATLEIEAGEVHTTQATVDDHIIEAGNTTGTTCEAFDGYGNPIPDASMEVVVDSTDGVEIDDDEITITRASMYSVACEADGATETRTDDLEVVPALPDDLAISKVPDKSYYGLGQVVEVAAVVSDQYGNRIEDASLTYDSQPDGEEFGHGRMRYHEEGVYTVTVTVDGETRDDVELEDSVDIEVNGQGPDIECDSPADGSMVDGSAADGITLQGFVEDAQGIDSLEIEGEDVPVANDGYFEYDLTTRYGMNYVDIVARDDADGDYQEENSTTCTFLMADEWAKEDEHMDDSVALALDQNAVDDGSTSGSINSLNDMLHTVLGSDGLENQIDSALLAQNPLVDDCYDYYLGCYNYEVNYIADTVVLGGPHDTSLELLNGGLGLDATLRNLSLDLDVDSDLADATGTVSIDTIDAEIDFDVDHHNGAPRVTVRPGTVNVEAGSVDIDVDGLPDWLDSIITSLAEGTVRSTVEDQLESFLQNDVNDMLDGVVGNLDVSSFGSTFSVPSLDGSGSIPIQFGVDITSVDLDTSRALFGLSTRIEADSVERATDSEGIALLQDDLLYTGPFDESLTAAVHVGTLNQVLHALWRGGLF